MKLTCLVSFLFLILASCKVNQNIIGEYRDNFASGGFFMTHINFNGDHSFHYIFSGDLQHTELDGTYLASNKNLYLRFNKLKSNFSDSLLDLSDAHAYELKTDADIEYHLKFKIRNNKLLYYDVTTDRINRRAKDFSGNRKYGFFGSKYYKRNIFLLKVANPDTGKSDKTGQGYVKGKKFAGYVFEKEFIPLLLHFDDQKERYTPTEQDIINAEQLIKQQLVKINQPILNQGDGCPIIHKSLGKYKRQYLGYINQNGDKVVWVNFIMKADKTEIQRFDKEIIRVLDGCSYYWNIKVNLTQNKLYDLEINGIG